VWGCQNQCPTCKSVISRRTHRILAPHTREALDAHGLQLFARIDHAAGARKADVELEANVLLIFGNPSVGTPLMQADPRVGVELPLRMLIR
jgi:uncharacterized protein (DUF302 family)